MLQSNALRSLARLLLSVLAAVAMAVPLGASAQRVVYPPEAPMAHNVKLVGYNDLFNRPSYMPHIQKQAGDRWILYVAHHTPSDGATWAPTDNGTSILDVTDASHPVFLTHIPGAVAPNNEARSMRACTFPSGKTLMVRSVGQIKFEVWDTTDPRNPVLKATIGRQQQTDGTDYNYTHKINWECESGIIYLPTGNKSGLDPFATTPKWKANAQRLNIWKITDANAESPQFIRSFGLPGMLAGSPLPSPTNIHHAIVDRERLRVHIGYGCCGTGIYQIVDHAKLLGGDPNDVDTPSLGVFPQPSEWGIHTAYPLNQFVIPDLVADKPGVAGKVRDLAMVVGEAGGNQCDRPRQNIRMFDVTPEAKDGSNSVKGKINATAISSWWLPQSAGDFCAKKGRFGPHSVNESYTAPFYGKMMAVAYFNAGVHMVDIRDPFNIKEVAYYIPSPVANTYYCEGGCFFGAIQTNNAEVDSRGYVYIVDRAGTGVHILERPGDAAKILWE